MSNVNSLVNKTDRSLFPPENKKIKKVIASFLSYLYYQNCESFYSFFPIANTLKWHAQHNYLNRHREQNFFSIFQKSKHIFCFTHILHFKMPLFKGTEHSSLHKTQQSDIKSHVCHFKTLPFKMTLHELCHLAKHLNG